MNLFDIINVLRHREDDIIVYNLIEEIQLQDLMEIVVRDKIPFMIGKIGGTELFALQTVEFNRKRLYKKACEQGAKWSGIFPETPAMLERFVMTMRKAIGEADLLMHWQKQYEAYFINKYGVGLQGIFMNNIHTAWSSENPWTRALKGKKVLIIHPFEKTIIEQYKKRKQLFKNPDILPEFNLLTIKAVQSIGGKCEEGYKDWCEGLNAMTTQAEKMDFDIALIGCGAYGLPLAANIKKMGKIAVHMGGDLQMLFGIMGKRWEKNLEAQEMKNEYWVYPDDSEKPEAADEVEGGCYW